MTLPPHYRGLYAPATTRPSRNVDTMSLSHHSPCRAYLDACRQLLVLKVIICVVGGVPTGAALLATAATEVHALTRPNTP